MVHAPHYGRVSENFRVGSKIFCAAPGLMRMGTARYRSGQRAIGRGFEAREPVDSRQRERQAAGEHDDHQAGGDCKVVRVGHWSTY